MAFDTNRSLIHSANLYHNDQALAAEHSDWPRLLHSKQLLRKHGASPSTKLIALQNVAFTPRGEDTVRLQTSQLLEHLKCC
jgi:hypothetical protein